LLFYFTSYVLNMFRALIYPSSGACDYSVELPHWSHCSWFDVFWSFGVVGLEWYPCCRLKLCFSLQVGLLFFNYHNDARSNKHKIPFLYSSYSVWYRELARWNVYLILMLIYFVRMKAYLDGRYLHYSCDNLNTMWMNHLKTLCSTGIFAAS